MLRDVRLVPAGLDLAGTFRSQTIRWRTIARRLDSQRCCSAIQGMFVDRCGAPLTKQRIRHIVGERVGNIAERRRVKREEAVIWGGSQMSVPTMTPFDFEELRRREKNIELIDVRTPVEYREVHAEPARLVPLDALDPEAVMGAAAARGDPFT